MSHPHRPFDFSHLSPAERILLAEELWDSVAAHPDNIPVPPEHLAELSRRIELIDSGAMEPGEPWDVVRVRLWKR
jgi:putative addiction module component (TIGR02574 family)